MYVYTYIYRVILDIIFKLNFEDISSTVYGYFCTVLLSISRTEK